MILMFHRVIDVLPPHEWCLKGQRYKWVIVKSVFNYKSKHINPTNSGVKYDFALSCIRIFEPFENHDMVWSIFEAWLSLNQGSPYQQVWPIFVQVKNLSMILDAPKTSRRLQFEYRSVM